MTSPPEPPAPPPARLTPAGRLGQGELRRQAAAHFAASPGAAFAPVAVARALNRSAGATGNALATLAARGEGERLPGKPARYRATDKTASAATIAAPAPRGTTPARRHPPASAVPVPPAAPAVGPPAAPAAGAPVAARPGKPAYRPRALADMADVAALRALRAASPRCCTGRPEPARPAWSRPRSRT